MKKNETTAVSKKDLLPKIARIMKLTIAFLLIACLQVSARGFSQDRITLKMNEAEIKKVLFAIEKKTNYRFLFSENALKKKPRVTIDAVDAPVTDLLDKILANTGVSYKILASKLVVLKEGMTATEIESQDLRVSGKVTSSTGEPLAGVSIAVKGSRTGTTTDAAGNFSLTVPDDATLVISSVGFETIEVAVAGKSSLSITLQQSARKIDEVVVIGYGQASKRDLTGSITKISGRDIADKPNVNPVASLQGKVAGLSVVNSGTPGQEPDIRIRGTNSLSSAGVKPLYLVDGIFNDNISFLNPNDIESIEILKDPSSLAIFGVRGANGVIAITTKKAKTGQVNINFNTTFGSKKLVDKIDMVNAAEFKMLFEEEQDNLGITGTDRFDFTPWTGNTDWVDAMTQTGTMSMTNFSVSTATDKNKFYLGLGYTDEEGIVQHERLRKMSLNLSDEVKVTKGIKLGFTLNTFRQRNPYGNARGLLFQARRALPVTPVYNDAAGAYYNLAIQSSQMINPAMELNDNWDKELNYENRSVASVYADISFLKNLNWRSTFYADMSVVDGRSYRPIDSLYDPIGGTTFIHNSYNRTEVSQSTQRWNKFQQDHILTFKKSYGDHGLTLTSGFTTYYNEYRGLFGSIKQSLTGLPIPNDKRFWYLDNGFGDKSTRVASSGQWEKATVSGLFRALYNFKGKYLLNGSFRRDWSSAWRQDYGNQGDNFYSVGAAWEVSKEGFFQNQNVFDYLKVKASFGVLGVQNTYGFDYPAYPSLATNSTAVFGTIIVPVYTETYLADRNLHWEKVHGKEIGIEFDMLKRKLHGEVVYYHKKTVDLLALISAGAGLQTLTNIGDMRNRGLELSASYTHEVKKDFTVTVSGNMTTFDNKFLNSPFTSNPDEQYPNRTVAGNPIGYFYGYVVEGVYQSYADKLASPTMNLGNSYGPGDLKYKDLNGDGVVNTDDRTMIGNPTPDFIYGGNVTVKYKGLDLSVDMQGVYGGEIYRYWGSSELPYTKFNYPKFKLNRWHGAGTSNWDPILGDDHSTNRLPSSYGIEDGSYFRIRNFQIGYNFNADMLARMHIKSLRAFFNIQNLKTWKRNSGYSPEFGGSPTSFGIDTGNDPIPMIISGGINVNF